MFIRNRLIRFFSGCELVFSVGEEDKSWLNKSCFFFFRGFDVVF